MESAVILCAKANIKFHMFAVMAFFFIHDIIPQNSFFFKYNQLILSMYFVQDMFFQLIIQTLAIKKGSGYKMRPNLMYFLAYKIFNILFFIIVFLLISHEIAFVCQIKFSIFTVKSICF